MKKEFITLFAFLLLLVLLLFQTSSFPDGFGSFKTGSANFHDPVKSSHHHAAAGSRKGHEGDTHEDGNKKDPALEDEKRRIHTGPNPLHNR